MDRMKFSLNPIPIVQKCVIQLNLEKERRYVKGYGFLSFARILGTHATKVTKNLNNKYGRRLADSAKKSATDAFKIASKRAIQKTAEATGDLVDNTIANKITSI